MKREYLKSPGQGLTGSYHDASTFSPAVTRELFKRPCAGKNCRNWSIGNYWARLCPACDPAHIDHRIAKTNVARRKRRAKKTS